ncbi:MAG TPA: UxaA family hydrolase, partial [Steroidobacteraceae bacterium]
MNAVAMTSPSMQGYLRKDGRKGIRNVVAVAYLVECAHHVSRLIVQKSGSDDVHLIGFPGCYPNKYSLEMMQRLCTHPNVGAVLLVSLGCEGFNREQLRRTIAASGRPVDLLVIQQSGGTTRTLNAGLDIVRKMRAELAKQIPVPMAFEELIVGTVCGGSDGTSGITANPAVGRCFDWLIEKGSACIFEETGELIGCERIMASRAITPALGVEIEACVDKAANYYRIMGYGSFAPGNAEGGLTTLEEKSMGAYSKSGSSPISGLIKPGDVPPRGGLYLLDVVPDGEPRF